MGILSTKQEKQIIKSFQQFLVNETGIRITIDGVVGPETITLMKAYVKTLVDPESPDAGLIDTPISRMSDSQKTRVKEIERDLRRKGYE